MIELTATQAAADIARGVISAEDYTRACLEQIAAAEGDVQAFAQLDPEHALKQARALDGLKADGQRIGPLHGVPVGIKDIFDTADYPTECGSPILANRRPDADAAAVRKLREANSALNRRHRGSSATTASCRARNT
jgi:Asp-tRNA(Asn)/Glu-tRNA(Gln) amidotransferase A subunit family amidase